MKSTEKGFTLIELLIVIGIIAILAAGAMIAINPGRQFQQARNSNRLSHMNTIYTGLMSATIENEGEFEAGCPASYVNDDTWTLVNATNCPHLVDYIRAIPTDPQGTDNYYRIRYADTTQQTVILRPSASATDSNLPTFGE